MIIFELYMKAIIYLPKTKEDWKALERKAGYIAGQSILSRINNFPISFEAKCQIIDELKEYLDYRFLS